MMQRRFVFTASFIVIFCCSASAAFSVFAKPLREATGGTASQVALTLTLYQLFMAIFGILSGKIVDAFGPKKLIYTGGFVFGLGWFLTGAAHSIPALYISCGLIAGAGNGLLYNPSINTALRWFPEKRGTMSGILLGAASLGPLVLAKTGAILSAAFGTAGFYYIGVFYFILVSLVAWKMEAPAKEWKPAGWSGPASTGSVETEGYTPSEMLKSGTFWFMFILFSIACTAGVMLIGSLSVIAQVQLNMLPVAAANLVVVNLISNFCGRLLIGKFCDKVGEEKMLAMIFILTIVSLLGLRFAANIPMFIVFLVILGGSFGGVLVVFPPMTSRIFGLKHFGFNYGIMFFGYAVGAFIGPQISAVFVNTDLGAKAYSSAFLVAAGVAFIGLVLNLAFIAKKAPAKVLA